MFGYVRVTEGEHAGVRGLRRGGERVQSTAGGRVTAEGEPNVILSEGQFEGAEEPAPEIPPELRELDDAMKGEKA